MEAKETVIQWIDFPALLKKADDKMKACEPGSKDWSYWYDVKKEIFEIFNSTKQSKSIQPILPSDEEIIKKADEQSDNPYAQAGYELGTKWMRDKLSLVKEGEKDSEDLALKNLADNDKIYFSYRDQNDEAQSGYMDKNNAKKELSRLMTFESMIKNMSEQLNQIFKQEQ